MQRVERASFSPNPVPEDRTISLDTLPQEYPGYGTSDFRHPAYPGQLPDGTTVTELLYARHRIESGKPKLEGLPAVYAERRTKRETLVVTLEDSCPGLKVELLVHRVRSIRRGHPLGASDQRRRERHAACCGRSAAASICRTTGTSCCSCPAPGRASVTCTGAPLVPGMQADREPARREQPSAKSVRRAAWPKARTRTMATCTASASYTAAASWRRRSGPIPYDPRLFIGINPFDFGWRLEPGESFQTPEAVMVYSSRRARRHVAHVSTSCTVRGCAAASTAIGSVRCSSTTGRRHTSTSMRTRSRRSPKAGSELGIELFVLDDGWFGQRDSDNSSLGDWFVDKQKLPDGLRGSGGTGEAATACKFGLWFEPEMVSPDSELYRAHPDWCLHVAGTAADRRRESS